MGMGEFNSGYLLTDFKTGDRVQFVGNHEAAVDLGYTGLTGTVTHVDSYAVTVDFEDPSSTWAVRTMPCSAKYLVPYRDIDVSDISEVEAFLNG